MINRINKMFIICLSIYLAPNIVIGQTILEHQVWQSCQSFEPMSHTAQAIIGAIEFCQNPYLAIPGSKMLVTFGNSKPVMITAIGSSWREWDTDKKLAKANVFRMSNDPGKLQYDNTLCGTITEKKSLYIAFYRSFIGKNAYLGASVFMSEDIPADINSPGLCGTYSFLIE